MIVDVDLQGKFTQPVWLDLLATFLYALVGASRAIRKGYDLVGVVVLALVASTGGGVLRDVLLQRGAPAVLHDVRFIVTAFSAALLGVWLHRSLPRFRPLLDLVDSVSIGLYAVVGAQLTLLSGLGGLSAMLIGFLNAFGGGLLLAVLMREEPEIFKPGLFYAVAVFVGLLAFVFLAVVFNVEANIAATISIVTTATIRTLALRLGWSTHSVSGSKKLRL
ncbi:MAG: TRIC cation channel family protein [Bacteroidetes bacterium]|nr:TRIC cation channel family protein [Bacteroidota bacterium]